jgi:hypothetical protein
MRTPLNERQAAWVSKRLAKGGLPLSPRYTAERAFGMRGDASPADRYAKANAAGNPARATRIASRHPYVLAPPELAASLRERERGLSPGLAVGGAGVLAREAPGRFAMAHEHHIGGFEGLGGHGGRAQIAVTVWGLGWV